MRSSALPLALLSAAVPDGNGPPAEKPGYVRIPLTYRPEMIPTVDIGLGSPKQIVRLALNTAYDRLLVNPPCSGKGICPEPERTFHKERSTSFEDLKEEKTEPSFTAITYGLATDNLSIGPAEIDSHVFGVIKNWALDEDHQSTHVPKDEEIVKTMPYGMLGVAPANANEPNEERVSVVKSLVEGGHIKTQAFSVDIQDPDKDGSIIFGGVDVKKFSGPLEKRKVMVSAIGREYIYMDEVSISRPGMGRRFCWFGHATIQVPIKDLVQKEEGYTMCYFHIFPTPAYNVEGSSVLGANILKFAYIFYDQAHDYVYIGGSKNCGSNIKAVDGNTRVESLQGMC